VPSVSALVQSPINRQEHFRQQMCRREPADFLLAFAIDQVIVRGAEAHRVTVSDFVAADLQAESLSRH